MSDRILPFPERRRTGGSGKKPKQGCPICGKPQMDPYRPFCSARCKQVDLGRWLGERYRVPTDEGPPERDSGEEQS